MIRRYLLGLCLCVLLAAGSASAAFAADPHSGGSTGQPSQTCGSTTAATFPGHASSSPGAPFNEPTPGVNPGGVGGQHYSPNSQYDVACFQNSQPHP